MDFVSEFFDKERINKLLDDHYHQKTNNGRKYIQFIRSYCGIKYIS